MIQPCREGHATCEGGSLHVAGRDAKGCAQLQDGSWITKNRDVCPDPHPAPRGAAAGPLVEAWLEGSFAANRTTR